MPLGCLGLSDNDAFATSASTSTTTVHYYSTYVTLISLPSLVIVVDSPALVGIVQAIFSSRATLPQPLISFSHVWHGYGQTDRHTFHPLAPWSHPSFKIPYDSSNLCNCAAKRLSRLLLLSVRMAPLLPCLVLGERHPPVRRTDSTNKTV